jgi:hypothetical protein
MFSYFRIAQGFIKYTIDSSKAIFMLYDIIESRGANAGSEHYSLVVMPDIMCGL